MGKIYRLIKRLLADSNLYVTGLKEKDIDADIAQFIKDLREHYLGDLIAKKHRPNRPIQLKPILNLQRTFDYLTSGKGPSKILTKDELPNYLNVINLYINDGCDEACSFCHRAYKQFLCCRKGHGGEMPAALLEKLLDQTQNSGLYRLNITGGNIFRHSAFREIVNVLDAVQHIKEYHIHYKNVEAMDFLNGVKNRLHIIVDFPVDARALERSLEFARRLEIKIKFRFMVQELGDIEKAGEGVSSFGIEDNELIPYYNGNNLEFFRARVFLDKQSIIAGKPTMNNILTRQTVDTWDFKKLTVLGNGDVYANLNQPKTGNLHRDHIFDLVERELRRGKSWTKVRKNVRPCKGCVFNALCPPISNYEYTLRRYNLCNIDFS